MHLFIKKKNIYYNDWDLDFIFTIHVLAYEKIWHNFIYLILMDNTFNEIITIQFAMF